MPAFDGDFGPGLFGVLAGMDRLSEGQFVGGFERRATDAADDCGAVAADEGVGDDARAGGTPELGWVWLGFGCEWVGFGMHL